MNFFPNENMLLPIPGVNNNMIMTPGMNPNMDFNNVVLNKFNELENHLKRLEQRITRLENEYGNEFNYNEPDNSLYMI